MITNLETLETLINDFYSPLTKNEKKKEIESLLLQFQQELSPLTLTFLHQTDSSPLKMFLLNALENFLLLYRTELQERSNLRNTLGQMLQSSTTLVPFVRNKIIEIIVIIARIDWPENYKCFFDDIITLLSQENTVGLGLSFVQMTSEEFMSPREGLLFERKEQLKHLFQLNTPKLFSIFQDILGSVKSRVSSIYSSCETNFEITSYLSILNQCFQCLSHLFSCVNFLIKDSSFPIQTAISIDSSNLFSKYPNLFSIIIEIATSFFFKNGSFKFKGDEWFFVSTSALNCLYELLNRNFTVFDERFADDYNNFIWIVSNEIINLLSLLSQEQNHFENLDEQYLSKLIDLLNSLVTCHIRKFQNQENFPLIPFFNHLIKFTIFQSCTENLFRIFSIWHSWLDSLLSLIEEEKNQKLTHKLKDSLLNFISLMLSKVQFKTNKGYLETLDNDVPDCDFKTEWQNYIIESVEIVTLVSRFFPDEVLTLVEPVFKDNFEIYLKLHHFISEDNIDDSHNELAFQESNQPFSPFLDASRTRTYDKHVLTKLNQQPISKKLNITSSNDLEKLHCSLRDLSTSLQFFSSLVDLFIDQFQKYRQFSCIFILKLISLMDYNLEHRMFQINSNLLRTLEFDFISVHSELLVAMKSLCPWLSMYQTNPSDSLTADQPSFQTLVHRILHSLVPLFLQKYVPNKVLIAGSELLMSLMTSVRPFGIHHNQQIQSLYLSGIKTSNTSLQVQILTYKALIYYLLLPWVSSSFSSSMSPSQEWDKRSDLVSEFVNRLFVSYLSLKNTGIFEKLTVDKLFREQIKSSINKLILTASDIIHDLDFVPIVTKSKQICYQAFEPVLSLSLRLLPVYIDDPDTTLNILGLLQVSIQTLRLQMGAPLVTRVVQDLMDLFTKINILEDSVTNFQIIDKFLQILQTVSKEPASIFKQFLPNILQISISNIYPFFIHKSSNEVKISLFSLFFTILKFNWKYFFPNQLLTFSNNQSNIPLSTANSCLQGSEDYFMSIMRALGESFLQSDLDLFRQNIGILENLNDQFCLYSKDIFRNCLLSSFLPVFLQVLIKKSHDILKDDLTTAIYNMACVDFDWFFSTFMDSFINDSCKDEQSKVKLRTILKNEKDLPTFSKQLDRLINDIRFYKTKSTVIPSIFSI